MLDVIQTLAIVAIAAVVIYKIKPNTVSARGGREVILDSCALIDGRVVELAKAGFLPERLIVPKFILAELQLLADGSDSHKRERARFGLEIVQQLQQDPKLTVVINAYQPDAKTTDEKLVKLAQKLGADLFTTDFNLNQVANIEGVRVLNINELSHAMRPVALPGEAFEIKIVQAGSNRDQGVGYLEDGTMVVVDNARSAIGSTIQVKVTKTHQTVAGKMLFGTKVGTSNQAKKLTARPAPSKVAPIKKRVETPRRQERAKPQRAPRSTNSQRRSPKEAAEASLLDAINQHGE